MRTETKTSLFLLTLIGVLGIAAAWAYQPTEPIDGQWRVTPLNNGGYVIEGPMPQLVLPEVQADAMFTFEAIDRQGNSQGQTAIPIGNLLSVGAEAWPIYDEGRENVIGIRYGTAVRYGDGRWAWVDREYHEVVAELLSLGWARGEPPARWTHPLDGQLPVPRSEWR